MGKVLSIHSSRGGTGKSVIAVNLAMALLRRGFDVSLIDVDFRAPSLLNIFKKGIEKPCEYWVNDFLNDQCKAEQVLVKVLVSSIADKKLLVGLANPSVNAIRDIMGKSKAWEVSALKKLYSLRSLLLKEKNMDYVIYDTSPGIHYSSINAIITSDLPIIVVTSDPLDIEGTRIMLSEFYEVFEKKTLILANKVFPETDSSPEEREKESFNKLQVTFGRTVIGIIPCYCDVLRAKRDYLLGLQDSTHPFARKLEEVAEKLIKY
jgi:septum site-determining protein MinD